MVKYLGSAGACGGAHQCSRLCASIVQWVQCVLKLQGLAHDITHDYVTGDMYRLLEFVSL